MDSISFLRRICMFLLFSVHVNGAQIQAQSKVFDVTSFGAVADSKTDNSKAFLAAWKAACAFGSSSTVLVPRSPDPNNKYVLYPVIFAGPCRGPIEFAVNSVILAPGDKSTFFGDNWINFRHLNNFILSGGGTFDGQGPLAWQYNNCDKNSNCQQLRINLKFDFVNNSLIHSIQSVNSKNFHISVFSSSGIVFRHLRITAPAESPNTDGIHLGKSGNVQILDSIISTGDDCVSIGDGCNNIGVTGVHCGPGHGFSVGSLGKYQNEQDVSGLLVKDCTMADTDNGVRIKSWASSLKLSAYNLTFDGITMNNVKNPIIIDQQYCPTSNCGNTGASNVQISDVQFNNIQGTSATPLAVNLICSSALPCKNVQLKNINLRYRGRFGPESSRCENVIGNSVNVQSPRSCV